MSSVAEAGKVARCRRCGKRLNLPEGRVLWMDRAGNKLCPGSKLFHVSSSADDKRLAPTSLARARVVRAWRR